MVNYNIGRRARSKHSRVARDRDGLRDIEDRMSLRIRLTLFFTLFLAFVLTVAAVVVYGFTQRSILESVETRANQTYRDLFAAVQDNANPSFLSSWAQGLSSDGVYYVSYYIGQPTSIEDLRVLFQYVRPRGMGTFVATNAPNTILERLSSADFETLLETGSLVTRISAEGENELVVRAGRGTFQFGELTLNAPALLIVGLPVPTETLAQLRRNLVYTVLIAFVIFALGVYLLSSRVLLPLKRVTTAASRVSSQDLSQRVPVPKSRDEVGELSVTLNRMLDRLQESFDTQRRFTADASHELRTPVTVIAGHVNYLLRRTQPSPEQVESLTTVRNEAARMGKLVNDLLELARADAGFEVEREPLNLVEVIETVHREVAPVAKGAEVSVTSPQPLIEVAGDAARLKQVVLNLVQNALNAGSKHITISLLEEQGWARLEVLDDGPGIPKEAIPNLFDRFYRVDGARSTRGNGSGLGLAIVKWIVKQHSGEVTVESGLGEGTVFIVMLPLLGQPLEMHRAA